MRILAILACAAVLAIAPIAHADPATSLKQQGLRAAQSKNWELARERFEQSYALDPRPLTLFNLAVAQDRTDKLLDARASYAGFLDQPATGDSEPFRKLARTAVATLDKAIPTLHVHTTGLIAGDIVELDGRELTTRGPTALDPGSHTVMVYRGRDAIAQRTVVVVRAARDDIELAVPAPPPVVPRHVEPPAEPATRLTFERPTSPPPPARASLLRSGWFWGVTAAVVLSVAGAGYYYLSAPTQDPMKGTLGPGVLSVP